MLDIFQSTESTESTEPAAPIATFEPAVPIDASTVLDAAEYARYLGNIKNA